jgi:hypothetical protein
MSIELLQEPRILDVPDVPDRPREEASAFCIPEPSALWLWASGGIALGWLLQTQKAHQEPGGTRSSRTR